VVAQLRAHGPEPAGEGERAASRTAYKLAEANRRNAGDPNCNLATSGNWSDCLDA
jgi:hypothetical protein